MRSNAEVSGHALFSISENDVIMGCLPLFHAFGQTCAMNTSVLAGAMLSLLPRFDPATALKIIERDKVTIFEGVPTMYVAMLHAGPDVADTSSLRLCVSGGAALPGEVLNGFAEAFGASILEGYGLSETSPVASFNRAENAKAGSIGLPIDGVEMRLVGEDGADVATGEIGEIAIRGDNVMRGYWNRPDETARATAGSLVLSSAQAAWDNRATVEDLPLFSAFWEREAQLPTATSGDAQFVEGAVNSSEIPERDLSVQLAGWMLMEAAHTVAGQP